MFSDFAEGNQQRSSLTIGFSLHGKKATVEQKATLNTRVELGRITNNQPLASGHMIQSFKMIDSSFQHAHRPEWSIGYFKIQYKYSMFNF